MSRLLSVFRELYQAPRSWAEQAYPNLIYFNEVDEATTSQPGRSPSRRARCGRIQVAASRRECVMSSTVETATEIRPFDVEVPQERWTTFAGLAATRWPSMELVDDRRRA